MLRKAEGLLQRDSARAMPRRCPSSQIALVRAGRVVYVSALASTRGNWPGILMGAAVIVGRSASALSLVSPQCQRFVEPSLPTF